MTIIIISVFMLLLVLVVSIASFFIPTDSGYQPPDYPETTPTITPKTGTGMQKE